MLLLWSTCLLSYHIQNKLLTSNQKTQIEGERTFNQYERCFLFPPAFEIQYFFFGWGSLFLSDWNVASVPNKGPREIDRREQNRSDQIRSHEKVCIFPSTFGTKELRLLPVLGPPLSLSRSRNCTSAMAVFIILLPYRRRKKARAFVFSRGLTTKLTPFSIIVTAREIAF